MDEKRVVKNPTAMLVLHGVVIAVVVYMFYQVVQSYIAGGEDAPSLATVIVGGVILLAGCVLVAYMAVRIYLQEKRRRKEEREEAEHEDSARPE